MPRKKVVAVCLSRLDLDTNADDLKVDLTAAGLVDVFCRKLKSKDGREFKTAAFYVSCDPSCRDKFEDPDTWPEGSEVREWVFHDSI